MNGAQRIVAVIAAINLAIVLLFPPYDYVSMLLNNVATFDGFYFIFSREPHHVLNTGFLTLEVIVVLANAGIAMLLMRGTETGMAAAGNRRQRKVLVLVAVNLILIVLFPPFEAQSAITKAVFPTFEGFRFVFGDNPLRQIVTPILFIEMALVLINGALLWLLFKDKTPAEISSDQMRDLAQRIASGRKH